MGRHQNDNRLNGVIAAIKWGGVLNIGVPKMKAEINKMTKRMNSNRPGSAHKGTLKPKRPSSSSSKRTRRIPEKISLNLNQSKENENKDTKQNDQQTEDVSKPADNTTEK